MKKRYFQNATGVLSFAALVVAVFWCVGIAMLVLRLSNVVHIENWLIALFFWAPYALFMVSFILWMAIEVFRGKFDDNNRRR